MKNTGYIFCLVFSLLCIEGNSEDINHYFNMSLEELLTVQVTTPSRRGENQLLAPGIVSVITAQEIHQFGARHLGDVLNRVVNTQVIGARFIPHLKTSLRATNASTNDTNVLLLLNGHPIRNAMQGGLNADIYGGFPLDIIHHIEIIRGPGSVMYGTNATAGIINIVTLNQADVPDQSQINVGMGSFDQRQIQLSTNLQTDDYKLTMGANLLKSEGDDFIGVVDKEGHLGTHQTGEDDTSLVVSGNYQGFSFDTLFTNSVFDRAVDFFQIPSRFYRLKKNFSHIGYQQDVTDAWHVSLDYTLSKAELSWVIFRKNNTFSETDGREQLFEATAQGQFEDFNVLLGINYATLSAIPRTNRHVWRKSAFTQADYLFSEKQKFIAGIQWNEPEESDGNFSPRIGFIQGFGENWWLKLLYSEAFRSPFLVELFSNTPVYKGNPNLKPERVATTDVQLIYQTHMRYFGLTLYHSVFTDIISQMVQPGESSSSLYVVKEVNKGEISFYGIEFEGKLALNDYLTLEGNASYQHNEDENGIENNTFAPNVMLKLGLTYTGKPGVTIGIFNNHIGESTDLSETLGNPAVNPKAAAYNLLTANLSLDTGQLWEFGKPNHSIISLYLDNLLNETIYSPDLYHLGVNNTVPHHWGFGAYINYQYSF